MLETECPGSQAENYPGLKVSGTSGGKVPLDDTKGAIWRDGVFLFIYVFIFTFEYMALWAFFALPLGGILSQCETPERFWEL